jgi:hypothetical protein
LDEAARLSRSPDDSFDELRRAYAASDDLRVPASVLNAQTGQREAA